MQNDVLNCSNSNSSETYYLNSWPNHQMVMTVPYFYPPSLNNSVGSSAPSDSFYYQPGIGDSGNQKEVLFVNPKQYTRILKRRKAKAALIRKSIADPAEENASSHGKKKKYIYKSRHEHACARPRGPGGKFLTAAETQALKLSQRLDNMGEENSGNGITSAQESILPSG